MKRKGIPLLIVLVMIGSVILSACQAEPETVVVTQVVEVEGEPVVITQVVEVPQEEDMEEMEQPVTMDAFSTTDIPTLDPQVGEDAVSINYIENLFVHLTNYDLVTSEVVPEAATEWSVSENGLTWTFTLRTDIPWVYHVPGGETTQVVDEEGNPRFVTAHDFEYGIKRACDPNIGSYYSTVVAPVIKGCSDVLGYEDPANIPAELVDAIGVSATADDTLVIELEFPAGYFLSMTPMWTLAASPQWAIEEIGEQWIEAGYIVTNGRYVLDEWVHGVRRKIMRNPLMPADMAGDGNIEVMVANVVPDASTGYALWLNGEVDFIDLIPDAEVEAHLAQFPDETIQIADLAVFYIAFRMTKPPFDDVHVRRAFGAAFDRETYVNEVILGQGVPMKHFAPPGIFGAPPIDEVGVGYDPEFAAAELAEAGYPNCEGFPQVTILGYSGQRTLSWIEYAQGQWEQNLGCSADTIVIEQQTFAELLASTAQDQPDETVPHMWTLAWGPDYADENNWVGDVLWCESENRSKRSCNEIDDLILQAREEPDQAVRAELYRQVEEDFFGPEGEYPFFPVYLRIQYAANQTWLSRIPALFGGQQWYNWDIDWEAKQAGLQ
ncbi:MAG: peptide ABC transporter substrate-binding protein [Anaerolineales bacterium]|nr:peptide ABC transporter substrate-binding protein [Anaerolineales bacterium]